MRQIIALLLVTLLAAPKLAARANHDWAAVQQLTPGVPVRISLWNGSRFSGYIISVSDSSVRLDAGSRGIRATGSQVREINRKDIRQIVRIPEPHLPNPEKWMATGALIGTGAGATVGAVEDARHGNNARWFFGGLAGAALGFFGSCVVLTAVGISKGVPVLAHHGKVVYEAVAPPPSN